jgi:hypothetical protein
MSDPVPAPTPVVDPVPVSDPTPVTEGTQTVEDKVDNGANYIEHVLDEPYYGWAFNGTARINLSGQRIFVLQDDGTPVQYGTPPDLI